MRTNSAFQSSAGSPEPRLQSAAASLQAALLIVFPLIYPIFLRP